MSDELICGKTRFRLGPRTSAAWKGYLQRVIWVVSPGISFWKGIYLLTRSRGPGGGQNHKLQDLCCIWLNYTGRNWIWGWGLLLIEIYFKTWHKPYSSRRNFFCLLVCFVFVCLFCIVRTNTLHCFVSFFLNVLKYLMSSKDICHISASHPIWKACLWVACAPCPIYFSSS